MSPAFRFIVGTLFFGGIATLAIGSGMTLICNQAVTLCVSAETNSLAIVSKMMAAVIGRTPTFITTGLVFTTLSGVCLKIYRMR